jgi:hypothetical protein
MVSRYYGLMVSNCLSKFVLRLGYLILPFGIKLLNFREKRILVETSLFGKKLGFRWIVLNAT